MNVFLDRYKKLGQEINPVEIQIPKSIRINTIKIDSQGLLKVFKKEGIAIKKIPYLDFGYEVENTDFSLASSPEYLMGYYYIQELASQIPVQILNPSKNDIVLDMAAAPGGKTTQIAQYMDNKGILVALDNNHSRLMTLRNNLERLGVTNTIIYHKDAEHISDFKILFDKILLDAPCSGNFCIDAGWFNKRDLNNLKTISKVQRQMLHAACDVLKKGGELVYSTCSLEPEEDEMVVDYILKERPELKIRKIHFPLGDDGIVNPFGMRLNPLVANAKRFWPNKTKTQGFFIAKFRKEE